MIFVTARVVSIEPGYVTTPICMVQAAYVLMAERDKLPPGYVVIGQFLYLL